MKSITRFLAALLLIVGLPASAYDFIGSPPIRWPAGPIVIILQLDQTLTTEPLSDGRSSWNSVANGAFGDWNSVVSRVQFETVGGSSRGDGNDKNEVFFDDNAYGRRFGGGVLAITTIWRSGGSTRVEGDTIFNSDIDWDSYRGDLRGSEIDLYRVALHEFGHLLGLDHPDEAGQTVRAVMNSRITDLDHLVDDDIFGAQALYAGVGQDFDVFVSPSPPEAGIVTINPYSFDGAYPAGTIVNITARPSKGYRFNFWSGMDPMPTSRGKLIRLPVYTDINLVANFVTSVSPKIVRHPEPVTVSSGEGSAAVFTVRVSNSKRVTYQWQFNGNDIPGETFPTLILEDVATEDAGLYSVIVSNQRGQTPSRPARLVVDGN